MALADSRIELLHVAELQCRCDTCHRLLIHQLLERKILFAHSSSDGVLALFNGFFAALFGEPLADFAPGALAGDKVHPVLTRCCVGALGREDFHGVTTGERSIEWHQTLVDFGTHGAVPDLGVDGIGEVDRGRSGGQPNDFALRGKDVNLFRADFVAQGLQELRGIRGLCLPVRQVG